MACRPRRGKLQNKICYKNIGTWLPRRNARKIPNDTFLQLPGGRTAELLASDIYNACHSLIIGCQALDLRPCQCVYHAGRHTGDDEWRTDATKPREKRQALFLLKYFEGTDTPTVVQSDLGRFCKVLVHEVPAWFDLSVLFSL